MPPKPKARVVPEGGITILGACDTLKGNCAPVAVRASPGLQVHARALRLWQLSSCFSSASGAACRGPQGGPRVQTCAALRLAQTPGLPSFLAVANSQNEITGKPVRKLEACARLWTYALRGEKQVWQVQAGRPASR